MSVIMIGGEPATGKTTLVSRVIEDLCNPININPLPLFPCQQHDDVLVVGRYAPGKTFNGTDGCSYSAIPKFRQFIEQEYMNYKHIIVEGDRFFRISVASSSPTSIIRMADFCVPVSSSKVVFAFFASAMTLSLT